ncbi:hypothetical protein DUI87_23843 [Hirundo rustica rustica]|uniref:Uncharacterized protein n=1 Tax=Hirundo rustica rustica TaxID=333673 RepID=A0A3M0JGT6_HIRRU|nr:hypothetical protein DUI87_23843 [Hirundo rustica rustica]
MVELSIRPSEENQVYDAGVQALVPGKRLNWYGNFVVVNRMLRKDLAENLFSYPEPLNFSIFAEQIPGTVPRHCFSICNPIEFQPKITLIPG